MAYPQDAPHYHGRVVTVNPSTGRYTGLTAADPLYTNNSSLYTTPLVSTPQSAVALTVSGGATPSNTSAALDVHDASSLVLQIRNGNSTSLNVYVYTSPDDSVYDDISWSSCNLGANQEKSILISPGIYYMKVTVTNADAANTTTVTTKLTKRY